MHGHTRDVLLSVAMSTPKKPEDPPSNSCGIFILGLIVYTVLFFLFVLILIIIGIYLVFPVIGGALKHVADFLSHLH